ncbi:MAG: response regulator [Planctomycetes bacterium]|nr:response regulator [Planctomycetota bacterium]
MAHRDGNGSRQPSPHDTALDEPRTGSRAADARRPAAGVSPHGERIGKPLAGRRLLVADDEPTLLESLNSILTYLGADVDLARDGRQAVEMGLTRPYDLVLSDIRMPHKNGYEVYRELRAAHPEVAVVLMTAFGYDPSHAIVKASEDGLRAVLLKPFKMQALFEQINQALGTDIRLPSPSAEGE